MEPLNKKYLNIYEPQEDSNLLLKYSKLFLNNLEDLENKKLNILEIGVGSGFVLSNLEKEFSNNNLNSFYGTDINSDAINFSKNENSNLNLKLGDLFSPFNKINFDLVLFNTPYFPIEDGEKFEDLSLKDRAIYGGKKGWEVIEKFIIESRRNFNFKTCGIMIFSSLSNLEQIKTILKRNLFDFEILEEENSFFEKIICLKFFKLKQLEKLEELGVSDIDFLALGKHSIVLDCIYKNNKSIAKIGKFNDIQIENKFLEKLKNEDFTPKLFYGKKDICIREKLLGENIEDFLKNSNKENTILIFNKILKITRRFDELNINKQEMTNPYKHIFIDENLEVKFIDYERCLHTLKPRNTTQFLQYIKRNIRIFKTKDIFIDDKIILEFAKKLKLNNSLKFKFENLFFKI